MKTPHANAMLEAIREEPALFEACLARREELTRDFVSLFTGRPVKRVYFCGSGSVSHASLILKYAVEKFLKVEASHSYSSLFNRHEGFDIGGRYSAREMVLICPSETGRTKGPVEAARRARELGIASVCTVQSADSILARECGVVIPKLSGAELALPSTKGHSVGILTLLLCVLDAARALGTISEEEYGRRSAELQKLPDSCRRIIGQSMAWFDAHQDVVMNAPAYRIIGYGANYGTALEGALKFVESHKRLTLAYELEEFLHGPLGTVRYGDVIFLLCAEDGPEKDRTLELYRVLRTLTGNCVLVGPSEALADDPLSLAFPLSCGEFLNTLELLIPIQILSYRISDCLGLDTTVGMNRQAKLAMEPSYTE